MDTPKHQEKSARLEILKGSLLKKEAVLDQRFTTHFADVKSANGQPLNDKRNGRSTFRRWERQEDSIRNTMASIEKTKNAIEYEECLIRDTARKKDAFPQIILDKIESGELTQWRKHPNILFVKGVDKARIYFYPETVSVAHKYTKQITDREQHRTFARMYNELSSSLNKPTTKK